jgi:hypothetical protein
MTTSAQRLTVGEKLGYSCGDAAANFVFMSMILFQASFYTDVFGISAGAAASILMIARLWDAFFDPIMGVLADRTRTRWGRFRPWILWTAGPWAAVMILAYTTPKGWSMGALILYASVTNTLLMTLYSMNNMPYSALGGVMTGDVNERAQLNSYRFVSVNIAQFIVGGLTLPLVARFAVGSDRQHGWQMTMTVWAVLCLILFLITFFTTRERIQPVTEKKSSPKQDFADLLKNSPWIVMVFMTLVHFAILSFRGSALYNYYHSYADKAGALRLCACAGADRPRRRARCGGRRRRAGVAGLHCAWDAGGGGGLECGRRGEQSGQHARHGRDDRGHPALAGLVPPLRQEGGRDRGVRAHHGLLRGVQPARARQCRRHAHPDRARGGLLRSDHSAGLGDVRGCRGLFRMEDRAPVHRHCFRHHRFRAQVRPRAGVVVVPLDHVVVL